VKLANRVHHREEAMNRNGVLIRSTHEMARSFVWAIEDDSPSEWTKE
jgi:hypothetical protein